MDLNDIEKYASKCNKYEFGKFVTGILNVFELQRDSPYLLTDLRRSCDDFEYALREVACYKNECTKEYWWGYEKIPASIRAIEDEKNSVLAKGVDLRTFALSAFEGVRPIFWNSRPGVSEMFAAENRRIAEMCGVGDDLGVGEDLGVGDDRGVGGDHEAVESRESGRAAEDREGDEFERADDYREGGGAIEDPEDDRVGMKSVFYGSRTGKRVVSFYFKSQ